MINIAKLRVSDVDSGVYFVSIDSYSEFVTVAKKMKQSEPNPLFVNGYLCTLLTNLNEDEEVLLSIRIKRHKFDTETILSLHLTKETPEEAVVRSEKPEIVRRLNIVDMLYEINKYFIALRGLPV